MSTSVRVAVPQPGGRGGRGAWGARLRSRRRLLLALGVAVVLLAAATQVTVAAASSGGTSYRTAIATRGTVQETLQRTGTVEPVQQAAVAFPVAGTVATVAVRQGDAVTTGQTLATLDTSALQAQLTSRQAALAAAQLTLSKALNGQATSTGPAPSGTGGGGSSGSSAGRSAGGSSGGSAGGSSSGSAGGSSGGSAGGPSSAAPTTAGSGSRASAAGSGSPKDEAALAASQQQVLSGQKQVDADLRTASVALQAATAACASSVPVSTSPARNLGFTKAPVPAPAKTTRESTTTVPATGRTGTTGGAGTGGTGTTGTTGASGLGSAACLAAEKQVLVDQQAVAKDEHDVADAETALDGLLTSRAQAQPAPATPSGGSGSSGSTARSGSSGTAARSTSSAGTAPTASSGGGSSAGGSTGGAGAGGASSSPQSSVPTAADLVADQSAVDAATADVATAQQSLAQATIVSPMPGTVAMVGLTGGQQVQADSSSANVVVVGHGGDEVATTVSVDDVGKVQVDDAATVVPDGTGTPLDAKVVSIGVVPTVSGTTTTYPVVVGFTDPPPDLRIGTAVSVMLEVGSADGAVTVPTSAVRAVGDFGLVTVRSGGKNSTVRVTVGATGPDRTEIKSGLQPGQVVVLADLGQPLPSSNVNPNRFGGGGGLGGLGGGLGGGGGGGGGRFVGGGGGPRD